MLAVLTTWWLAIAGVAQAAPPGMLTLPDPVRDDLVAGRWQQAAVGLSAAADRPLSTAEAADLAFVQAWVLVRADRAAEAARFLPRLAVPGTAPAAYRDLTRGEILFALDRLAEADAALASVPADHVLGPRAVLVRAEVLRARGRTSEASALLEGLVARPDPSAGSHVALLALAERRGPGSDASYPWLRRLWTHYPATSEGRTAASHLAVHHADRPPTPAERIARAAGRMEDGAYDDALDLLAPLDPVALPEAQACELRYVAGRSHYKRNRLSSAMAALGPIDAGCVGVHGEKILYLYGAAAFRRGRYDESARAYAAIADHHAVTTYADDGLTRAGIAHLEAGRPDAAAQAWELALERFPDGDTVPEAAFRLAFTRWIDGDLEGAIALADTVAALAAEVDEVHVPAAIYWGARWRVHPDPDDPTLLREQGRTGAVARFARLIQEHPHSVYAALAHARVRRLDPPMAAHLVAARPAPMAAGGWTIRPQVRDDPDVAEAFALLRLGLVRAAAAAWDRVDVDALTAEEVAAWIDLRVAAGDWLHAHDTFHGWLREHPVGTLGPRRAAIIRLAYPDRYWDEVRASAASYDYDPRLLHALVREESSFNRRVVSFAGARGLAQLMPATAREVARRIGRRVDTQDLYVPETNLALGARYLRDVLGGMDGNPALALSGYNAGPSRTRQWVEAFDNPPLDVFMERIPYRETRGYVKRVLSTWQTMRWAFDHDRPAFVELGPFVDAVRPAP